MATIGDNSEPAAVLTDADRRALLLNDWIPKIERAEAQIKELKASLGETYKGCKAELGYSKADIKYIMDLEGDHSEEVAEEVIRKIEIARFLEHPLGTQFTFFDAPDRAPVDEKAENEGRQAGLRASDRTPPYDPTTSQFQAWLYGYDAGQKEVRDAFERRNEAAAIRANDPPGDDETDPDDESFDGDVLQDGDDEPVEASSDEGDSGAADEEDLEDPFAALTSLSKPVQDEGSGSADEADTSSEQTGEAEPAADSDAQAAASPAPDEDIPAILDRRVKKAEKAVEAEAAPEKPAKAPRKPRTVKAKSTSDSFTGDIDKEA